MARGWESKAVSEQMEQADAGLSGNMPADGDSSLDSPARQEQLESLRLSRARTLEQLARATNPHYRQMLERALQALDVKIAEIT